MSRAMLHGKDEALRLKTDKMQLVPIPYRARERQDNLFQEITADLSRITRQIKESDICILDWLRHEFGLDKPDAALAQPHDLVNAAYGLTPEDVALMWATAPPRMPFPPAESS